MKKHPNSQNLAHSTMHTLGGCRSTPQKVATLDSLQPIKKRETHKTLGDISFPLKPL